MTSGHGELSLFPVDKSLCLPQLKSMTVLLYDFSFKNENFATLTFVVKDMVNLQSKTSKDFLTSFFELLLNYYNVVFCIFKCILILFVRNIKCYHKTS